MFCLYSYKRLLLIAGVFISSSAFAESVYCLHGFMRKPSSMNKMARAFEREGYRVRNWGYPSREKTIQEHAEILLAELQRQVQEHPGEPIHFVTHSLGGIIVRCVHNQLDCPEEVKRGRIVMLAPPSKGSDFGRFLGKFRPIRKLLGQKAGKEILFSENFDYIGQFPEGKEILIISGTCGWNPVIGEENDGKVGVKESCVTIPHQHKTHFSGHSWIMYNKTVIENAKQFIMADQ